MKLTKLLIFWSLLISTPVLHAVSVYTSDGDTSSYETGTTTDAPWDNVLEVGSASGVYLGGGWVLTARHVYNSSTNSTTLTYNGIDYSVDTDMIYNFTDSATDADYPIVDLRLFRLEATLDGLEALSISAVSAGSTSGPPHTHTSGDTVTMIGYGGGTKRWGTNEIDSTGVLIEVSGRHAVTFSTEYNEVTDQAQAIAGDSGGGVFVEDGGNWSLTGMMIAVSRDTDPYRTYSVQLSEYQSEIESIMNLHGDAVPEPSSGILISITGLGFLLRRSRS